MTHDVVTRWLGALRTATVSAGEADVIEMGIAQVAHWTADGDPRATTPDALMVAEALRMDAAQDELKRALVQARVSLDLISRARLFAFSDEILDAAGRKASTMVGTPDLAELPFDVCWFHMDIDLGSAKEKAEKLLGCLITRDGWCGAYVRRADGDHFGCVRAAAEEGWDPASIPTVWTLWLLSRIAAGHAAQRTLVGSFAVRRELARARLRGAPLAPPPELYTIRLDARRAGHAIGRIIEARNGPSYRYEVRGHERMLVHRGQWPIAADFASDFRRRGYTVERGDSIDPRAAVGLDVRGLPPGDRSEWIAWRFAAVKEHEAGPKDAPVVRAVRVST